MRPTVIIVVLVGIGCASRSEEPARAARATHPPVRQFQSCQEMWRAGWTDGVRMHRNSSGMHGGDTEPYPATWRDAQAQAYVLNAHLPNNRAWHLCAPDGMRTFFHPGDLGPGTPHSLEGMSGR